jgi:hypothetical protein
MVDMQSTCMEREVDIEPGLFDSGMGGAVSVFHGFQERIQVVFFLILAIIPELAQIV